MVRQLIHPKMRTAIPDHWPSLCTILLKSYTVNRANQNIWDGVTGDAVDVLTNIPCRLGPVTQSVTGYDVKQNDRERTIFDQAEVILNVFNTSFNSEDHFAVVDGVAYQIKGIETDSQHFYTRFRAEIIT